MAVQSSPTDNFEDHGSQLWGLGYGSSNDEEDDMEYGMETEEEATMSQQMVDRIIYKQDFAELLPEEKEMIAESPRLRSVFSQRWWNPKLDQTYFVMYNSKPDPITVGEQLTYSYGCRSNV